MAFLKKLFIEDGWACFYRRKTNSILTHPLNSGSKFKQLLTSWRYWCADPFIIQENNKHYVFCELMDIKTSHGLLGLAELNPSGKTYVRPIADLNCHVSYPQVFKAEGTWYMIPETSERKTIELYKAVHFPDKWKKFATLATHILAVDTTVFVQNGKIFLFIYEPLHVCGEHCPDRLTLAELDLQTLQLTNKHLVKEYPTRVGRPAGNVWTEHGINYRPIQSGIESYGEKMYMYRFSFETGTGQYEEQEVKSVSLTDFSPELLKKGFRGCHTYNANEEFEIIDTTYARFSFWRPIRLFLKYFKIGGFCFRNQ